MKNLKKNLKSVNNDLRALAKKVDRMIVSVGKLEKQKTLKAKPPSARRLSSLTVDPWTQA